MHLAEGVLGAPVLIGSALGAAAGVALGLRRLHDAQLPLAALLGAVFFVASTVHVPAGVGSVHLILNGLAGLLLGWAVFPVIPVGPVGLLLQAALFSFGGFAVLGANTLLLALPAVAAHYLLRGWLDARAPRARLLAVGALASVIGIGGAGPARPDRPAGAGARARAADRRAGRRPRGGAAGAPAATRPGPTRRGGDHMSVIFRSRTLVPQRTARRPCA